MRLPSTGFLSEDSSQKCYPLENYASSIVIPSLPLTIKWLRDSVKDNPSLRLQVKTNFHVTKIMVISTILIGEGVVACR